MEANEQTFRHSFGKISVVALVIVFFGYMAFAGGDYFVLLAAVFVFILAMFYLTGSVVISSAEITTKRLLGSKTLRWSEIGRVSMQGEILRLHSRDEDLTLSLDSQLDGYTDLLDIIFNKRPDLLDKNDDHRMSLSWLGVVSTLGAGLAVIAIGISQFLEIEDVGRIFSLMFFTVGLFIIGKWFLSPIRLTLDGKDLIIGYWFKEVSHSAKDIDFVSLEKRRTKNGYIYFAQINLVSGKKIKLPAFQSGAQLTYRILKRWHQKAVAS